MGLIERIVFWVAGLFVAIYLIGAAFAGLDWLNPQPDANRQVTNLNFIQANGVSASMRYRATADSVTQTATAPECSYHGLDMFNPGSTDQQLGPGKNITFVASGPYSQRQISVSVPDGKIIHLPGNGTGPRVRFVYDKLVWYYDHTWDNLADKSASGAKGAISRCMAGLAPGQVMRIGLKRVLVYDLK